MSGRLFREGGPHRIKSVGKDRYTMTVSLPPGSDERLARECPNPGCSPGYFKVTPGTGILGGQIVAYCPYCRHEAEPNDFATREQIRYAKALALREAEKGVERMLKDAFGQRSSGRQSMGGGFISMKMRFTPATRFPIRRPFEDQVRRDVVCPNCTLDQTVFGLATWCADCGLDIFLTHVSTEIAVIKRMTGDIERRARDLGPRVGAKDLENCLEDAVSIFEASLRALVRRTLEHRHSDALVVEGEMKKLGNSFQSPYRTITQLSRMFDYNHNNPDLWERLTSGFEKRHPIAHNLGVIDKKYLERTQEIEREGRELTVSEDEVATLLDDVYQAIVDVHTALINIGSCTL